MTRARVALGSLLASVVLWTLCTVPSWAQQGEPAQQPGSGQAAAPAQGSQPAASESQTPSETAAPASQGGTPAQGATAQPSQSAPPSNECTVAVPEDILAVSEQPRQPQGKGEAPEPGQEQTPWAGATDVTPPQFLQTQDQRIKDKRPPPTAAQVAALKEMEAEVNRFNEFGDSYRETVNLILKREYLRQRRGRNEYYAKQIREEEKLLEQAREQAIRMFERFIRTYPNDPTYTPDAMFRLGELYFERSSIQFQDAYDNARNAGKEPPLNPDYSPTIDLYQRLATQFPHYTRADGVYYLIGYCLNEEGKPAQARMAWLNLVCANKFHYNPTPEPPPEPQQTPEEAAKQKLEKEHPAMTMGQKPKPKTPSGPFVNPYQDCQPVVPNARFVSETWFRIGEYHFDDYGDPNSIDLAISAYDKILKHPKDRNYNLALYKVAWAYYRASRYPQAIKYFGLLVDWSDQQRKATGKAGSELRPEAIEYLGISFAYDDWNENQIPDVKEGMPSPLQRVQDPKLMPQNKPWTPEVYNQVGQVLFDEAKYPDAIAVWELTLKRWPMNPKAPEIENMIAQAHQRHDEFQQAIAARAELSNYAEGSKWWNSNVDHPAEQRKAEELAEDSLIGTAIYYHEQAQQLRRQCVTEQEPPLCQQAEKNYDLAAQAYRSYLKRYPNNPQAYELRYNLADALYWSGNYEEAAGQYAAVRDSNLDDTHMAEAARRVVESLKRIVENAEQQGQLAERKTAPDPQGTPPRVCPIQMPELLQRLARARQIYITRVGNKNDSEHVLPAYDFNNALLLYEYGYWKQAKVRFERIYQERCKGPLADETGRVAWYDLNNMAVALNDTAGVEHWSNAVKQDQCTFGASEQALAEVDCKNPQYKDDPRCVAEQQITNIRFKRALATYHRAEQATGDEQRHLYEQAATRLVEAVNQEPNHPEAPLALEMAATALERTSRFDSAGKLYQRIIDEVGPRHAKTPQEQKQLDAILANAYFRLAYNANRFFDYEKAVDNYRLLADSQRFAASQDPKIQEKRQDALINAAIILEDQQQYSRAAGYYARASQTVTDPDLKRRAYYRLAEVAYKQKSYGKALKGMRDFISRYKSDPQAGELVVQAYWRIAQIYQDLNNDREYQKALQDVVDAFKASGQAPGSIAAEYAAHAEFLLTNQGTADFEKFKINPGKPRTMQDYVKRITDQIEQGSKEAKTKAEAFNPIPGYRRPTWTIAAFVQQGRIYEILAKAILDTPFVMPGDLRRKLRGLDQNGRDDIKYQVQDKLQQALDAKVSPIECLGVARYALAARAARAGAIDNEWTRTAIDRLQAYGDERIAQCMAQAQKNMSNLQAYQPGEFQRAPRGQHMQVQMDVAPPPLAGGSQ